MQKNIIIAVVILLIVSLGLFAWMYMKPTTTTDTSLTEQDWEENAPSTATLNPNTLDSEIMVHNDEMEM